MPQLQETDEDQNQPYGSDPRNTSQVDGASRLERRTLSLALPPPPANLTPQQTKRRHIVSDTCVFQSQKYTLHPYFNPFVGSRNRAQRELVCGNSSASSQRMFCLFVYF